MINRGALLGLVGLAACGPAAPQLEFDFVLSALLADQVSAFQVTLVTQGSSLDCLTVQATCLVSQGLKDERFIRVQDANGQEHKALIFPLALTSGSPNSSQDVTVRAIPPGKNYALVIEALSKDSPPKLAGSSCDYIQEITVGMNPQKLAIPIKPVSPPVGCDPRIEK